jgi:hypothetical protein
MVTLVFSNVIQSSSATGGWLKMAPRVRQHGGCYCIGGMDVGGTWLANTNIQNKGSGWWIWIIGMARDL